MRIPLIIAALALASPAGLQQVPQHSYIPPNGFVPDSATAIRIAVAVWTPIYGARQIAAERPFVVKLEDSVWTVSGSLPAGQNVGGVAFARIAKRDGRILQISHSL
jgi:NTF2 fold immunity protein